MRRRANAAGLGFWSPEDEGMNPGGSPALNSGFDWGNFTGSLLSAIGGAFNRLPAGQQGVPQQQGGNTLTVAEQIALIEAQRRAREDEIGSGSITSKGVKIGDTTISWPVLAGGALIVYLIQSPGFSRRR
jgi:hypothetical protein